MADMGGGQLPKGGGDRLLENQKDAGDSPMDVDGTLRTAAPDPLSDGDEILELALYEGGATAGSQTTQRAAAGEHLSDAVGMESGWRACSLCTCWGGLHLAGCGYLSNSHIPIAPFSIVAPPACNVQSPLSPQGPCGAPFTA